MRVYYLDEALSPEDVSDVADVLETDVELVRIPYLLPSFSDTLTSEAARQESDEVAERLLKATGILSDAGWRVALVVPRDMHMYGVDRDDLRAYGLLSVCNPDGSASGRSWGAGLSAGLRLARHDDGVGGTLATRKAIPKKVRFEVFKRDSFTCQYCGATAPDVLLVIDHIEPVSQGGTNDPLNLVTSCRDCNAGKSDRRLSDTAVLDKQRQQLADLQERKEQIEMMFQWKKELIRLDDEVIDELAELWSSLIPGYHLNENGMEQLRTLRRRFEIPEIIDGMKIVVDYYVRYDDGTATPASVEQAWSKVGGVCNNRRREKDDPTESKLRYIMGILKNRVYFDYDRASALLNEAVLFGASLDSLKRHAKVVSTWTEWRCDIEEFVETRKKGDELPLHLPIRLEPESPEGSED